MLGQVLYGTILGSSIRGTSYGFRPGRSAHDAIEAIFNQIRFVPKYVLDADIAKCFDQINHNYLINKVDNPYFRPIIKQWLKTGVMDDGVSEKTDSGTPQGGVISPLLANIALDGMIRDIQKHFPNSITKNGENLRRYKPSIIRYADDFVIIHKELEVINRCQELISRWLGKANLELKPEKTRICHTLNDIEINGKLETAGFDFLGFNIRQYPVGKFHSGKCNGKLLGFKTIIKPSSKAIIAHHQAVKEVIVSHRNAPQTALISRLNPIIRGWSNYFSTVCSKETFSSEDHQMWNLLRAWAIGRSKKGKWEALRKYFSHGVHGKWTFQTREDNGICLTSHSDTEIKRHTLVRQNASPYDGNWTYWSKRRGKYPNTPKSVSKLIKRQKGKCNLCSQHFTPEDLIEIDHIVPKSKGGLDTYKNYQALHRHCHHVKTKTDINLDISSNDYTWTDDVLTVPLTKAD